MELKYKNTIYEPVYNKTTNNDGLREKDFWLDIKFRLINDEIKFDGHITGISFFELIKWNIKNKQFLDGNMIKNDKITFIRRLGEIYYYPKKNYVEKRVYLFDDVNKYYSIIISKEELQELYNQIKLFIEANLEE